ncbi:hypothetical protein IID24_05095 [Patescibacteria group bacterium]|nr:hypothetical protein [Patescibacteria group bacterium]
MQVKEFHQKIAEFTEKWDKKRNVTPSEKLNFIHLVEEVGELATQYVNQEKRKAEYNEEELEDAIGDTFMQIVELANLRGLDIEKVVNKIIEEESPRLE